MPSEREQRWVFRRWPDAVEAIVRVLQGHVPSDGRIRAFSVGAADEQARIPLGTFWVECDVDWPDCADALLQVEVGRLEPVFDGVLRVEVEGLRPVATRLAVMSANQRIEANRFLVVEQRKQLREQSRAMNTMFANAGGVIDAAAQVIAAKDQSPEVQQRAHVLVRLAEQLVERLGHGSGEDSDADAPGFDDEDEDPIDFWDFDGPLYDDG
jgi:hypothetical protein